MNLNCCALSPERCVARQQLMRHHPDRPHVDLHVVHHLADVFRQELGGHVWLCSKQGNDGRKIGLVCVPKCSQRASGVTTKVPTTVDAARKTVVVALLLFPCQYMAAIYRTGPRWTGTSAPACFFYFPPRNSHDSSNATDWRTRRSSLLQHPGFWDRWQTFSRQLPSLSFLGSSRR